MTNLYNFMDGADGLAGRDGGVRIRAYACGGVASVEIPLGVGLPLGGRMRLRLSCCSTFRRPACSWVMQAPFRSASSLPALGLVGWRDGLWPLWFPPVAFAPFVTMRGHARAACPAWRTHLAGAPHPLLSAVGADGWCHRRLAAAEYGLMAGTAGRPCDVGVQAGALGAGTDLGAGRGLRLGRSGRGSALARVRAYGVQPVAADPQHEQTEETARTDFWTPTSMSSVSPSPDYENPSPMFKYSFLNFSLRSVALVQREADERTVPRQPAHGPGDAPRHRSQRAGVDGSVLAPL